MRGSQTGTTLRLDADIVAFQEVESASAAARVFDPNKYAIDIEPPATGGRSQCRSLPGQFLTHQKVGFAVKKGLAYRRLPDLEALGVGQARWAVEIVLSEDGTPFHFLAVHLKSGCSYGEMDPHSSREECRILAKQVPLLEQWIDRLVERGERVFILGDFNRQLNETGDRLWAEIDDGDPPAAGPERASADQRSACNEKLPK